MLSASLLTNEPISSGSLGSQGVVTLTLWGLDFFSVWGGGGVSSGGFRSPPAHLVYKQLNAKEKNGLLVP